MLAQPPVQVGSTRLLRTSFPLPDDIGCQLLSQGGILLLRSYTKSKPAPVMAVQPGRVAITGGGESYMVPSDFNPDVA